MDTEKYMINCYNNIAVSHKKGEKMNVSNQAVITEDGIMYLITYDDKGNILSKKEVTVVPPKPQKRKKTGYPEGGFYTVSFMYNQFIRDKYQKYNKVTFGVMNELLFRLEFNNRIETFRQKELADILKTGQANVSRAIKELEKDKVIYKPEGKYNYYFTEEFVKYAFVEERGKK